MPGFNQVSYNNLKGYHGKEQFNFSFDLFQCGIYQSLVRFFLHLSQSISGFRKSLSVKLSDLLIFVETRYCSSNYPI